MPEHLRVQAARFWSHIEERLRLRKPGVQTLEIAPVIQPTLDIEQYLGEWHVETRYQAVTMSADYVLPHVAGVDALQVPADELWYLHGVSVGPVSSAYVDNVYPMYVRFTAPNAQAHAAVEGKRKMDGYMTVAFESAGSQRARGYSTRIFAPPLPLPAGTLICVAYHKSGSTPLKVVMGIAARRVPYVSHEGWPHQLGVTVPLSKQ